MCEKCFKSRPDRHLLYLTRALMIAGAVSEVVNTSRGKALMIPSAVVRELGERFLKIANQLAAIEEHYPKEAVTSLKNCHEAMTDLLKMEEGRAKGDKYMTDAALIEMLEKFAKKDPGLRPDGKNKDFDKDLGSFRWDFGGEVSNGF